MDSRISHKWIPAFIIMSFIIVSMMCSSLVLAQKKQAGKSDSVHPDATNTGDDENNTGDTDTDATPEEDAPDATADVENDGSDTDEGATAEGEGEAGAFARSGRMEFDERLVKGQAAKSGAVYLFQRTPRRLPGLVPFRRSYRMRIVEPVLGKRELKPPVYSTEKKATTSDSPVALPVDTQKDQENQDAANAEEAIKQSKNGEDKKKAQTKKTKAAKPKKKSGGTR